MDWRKTIKRVGRKRGFRIKDLAPKAGYSDPKAFMVACCNHRTKKTADALEIPEETFLLEALRDSPNLPDHIRLQIIDIINELNPSAGE